MIFMNSSCRIGNVYSNGQLCSFCAYNGHDDDFIIPNGDIFTMLLLLCAE